MEDSEVEEVVEEEEEGSEEEEAVEEAFGVSFYISVIRKAPSFEGF